MTLTASPEAREASLREWSGLKARLQTVSPRSLGRGLLLATAVAVPAWVAIASWPALLPFAAGLVLAYAVLPVANRLDRFMPRVLAALIAVAAALAVIIGALLVIIPPLVTGLVDVLSRLPTRDQTQAAIDQLQAQIGTLPDPFGRIVLVVTTDVITNLQGVLSGFVDGFGQFLTDQILGILNTASFVLGLLVIPVWILTLVSDEQRIKMRSTRIVTPALQADLRALIRIADRALSTFLRVRVVLAVATGILVWLGLVIARELGLGEYRFAVAAATLLGMLQLIPELGFYLGFFPIVLVAAIAGPVPAATAAVVYAGSVKLASMAIETRLSKGVLDVHPGLLIPAIVALSQLGLIWLLAAGPVVAIARDTVRYLAGRLAEPPKPAGVLPGERSAAASVARPAATIPSVYRPRPARQAIATTLPPVGPPAVTAAAITAAAAARFASQRSPQP
jgi:predicted PurR-regulated permease PerM